MKNAIFISVAALVLASCAAPPESAREEQPAPVAAEWSTPTPVESAWAEGWVEEWQSPELRALVEQGLTENFDLRASAERLQAAIALASSSNASLYPQFDTDLNATRVQRNVSASGFTVGVPGGGGGPIKTTTTDLSLGLNVSWELDVWGRVADQTSAAIGDAQASLADFEAARHSLAAQLTQGWLDAIVARQQLTLSETTLATFQQTEDIIRRRYERGTSAALDLRLSLAQTEEAAAAVALRERQLDQVRRQLETLQGQFPDGRLPVPETLPDLPGPVPAGLPSTLLERRPDLIAAERRVAAAGAQVSAAKKAFLPRISLTSSIGTSSEELDDLVDPDFRVWSAAVNAVQPLFQGRRLKANLEQEQARMREVVAQYGQTALTAFQEVETALAAEGYLKTQLQRQEQAVEQSIAAEKNALRQYQRGLVDITTVLDAQRRSINAQISRIDVRNQLLQNRVSLYLALGRPALLGSPEEPATVPTPLREIPLNDGPVEPETPAFDHPPKISAALKAAPNFATTP